MDLRQLRYFVAVAEELHFTRASARLNLAQSALSSQVRALEREVGGPLLSRTSRRVALTQAGEGLLADAREVLEAADGALARARARARGEAGALVIGSVGPASGGLLAPVLSLFGSRWPDVRLEIRAVGFTELLSSLLERRVDLAFVHLPLDEPHLELTPLLHEQRVVVLPAAHRLAGRDLLRPADLAGERFVTHPDVVPAAWRDFWLLVDELGTRPALSTHLAENLEEWLHLIGRGEGIDTCPALISRYYSWPDVVFVPLADAAPARLALASRRDADDPLIDEFRRLATQVAATAASNPRTPYGPVQ